VCLAQKKFDEAESMMRRSLEMRKDLLGVDSADYASGLTGLGNLLRNRGDYARAEGVYRDAIASCLNAFGTEHPETATAQGRLARTMLDLGLDGKAERAEECLRLAETALPVLRSKLGPNHGETLSDQLLLGRVLLKLGRAEDASPILEELLPAARRDRSDVFRRQCLLVRAECLRALGKNQEAELLDAEAAKK
jgi:tetratricopeptide (TPR) repeat protein